MICSDCAGAADIATVRTILVPITTETVVRRRWMEAGHTRCEARNVPSCDCQHRPIVVRMWAF